MLHGPGRMVAEGWVAPGAGGGGDRFGTLLTMPGQTSLMSLSDLEDLGPATYGDLLREAITDLLEPRGGR